MPKPDAQPQQTFRDVGIENLYPRVTPAPTPHGHQRKKAMDIPSWRQLDLTPTTPSREPEPQSQYAAQLHPQLIHTQPIPAPHPVLQSTHLHSHPPHLTLFPLSLNPEQRSKTAPPPPPQQPPPPLRPLDQRAESLRTLALAPHATPYDNINIVLPASGKQLVFTVHRQLLTLFSPVFETLLRESDEERERDREGRGKGVVRRLRVKRWGYMNELDFGEDDDVGEEGEKEKEKEKEEVDLNVIIRLPVCAGKFPTIPLPAQAGTTSKEAFSAFIEWLYRGGGGSGNVGTNLVTAPSFPPPNSHIATETLVQLWVLAGRLGAPACQNECIVALEMARRESSVIETCMLEWVYENTREYGRGCGLRNLLVEQCAWYLDDEWITDSDDGTANADSFPRQALIDMVTTMKRMFGLSKDKSGWQPDFLALPERKGAYWVKE